MINLMMNVIKANAGNLKCDTNFALIDGFARSLKVSTGVNDKVEPMYAYDLHYVVVIFSSYMSGDDIYSGKYDEYDFLTSYNKMINQYDDVVNEIIK